MHRLRRCFKVCGRDVMTSRSHRRGEFVDLDDDEDEVEKKIMVMNDQGACIGCGACAGLPHQLPDPCRAE